MATSNDPNVVLPGCIAVPAAVVGWIPRLNEALQIGASLVAIVAGLIAIVHWYRGRKMRRNGSAQGQQPAQMQPPRVSPRATAGPADSQDTQ